jgi:DNA (cytosine-5)-methyltransferase 1
VTVSTLTVVPEATASGTAPAVEPTQLPAPAAVRRPRLLDLFCGGGGASAGYHAAGFDVVGVDIHPQPDYPFPLIQADALDVDLAGFDVIAASPPCQRWSAATPPARRPGHPDLIGPIRARLRQAVSTPGGPFAYVIENVPGAPLVDPVTVCGDTLRLGVRRHRLFESNLPLVGTPCWHDRPAPPVAVYGTYGQRTRRTHPAPRSTEAAREAMGIDWLPWPTLTQAVPPAFTHWLGVQLLTHQPATRDVSDQVACVTRDANPPAGKRHPDDETAAGQTSPGDETRRRLPSPGPGASVTSGAASSTGLRHCRCGNPLPARPATGRWPRYCSHACRQAAYRARQGGAR